MRGEVNKALEVARGEKRIGGSLQAELTLFAKPELAARLNALADELRFVLLTSKAKGRQRRCRTGRGRGDRAR